MGDLMQRELRVRMKEPNQNHKKKKHIKFLITHTVG